MRLVEDLRTLNKGDAVRLWFTEGMTINTVPVFEGHMRRGTVSADVTDEYYVYVKLQRVTRRWDGNPRNKPSTIYYAFAGEVFTDED